MTAAKQQSVHLETLIGQFERAGFRVGLVVARDDMERRIWFDGGVNDAFAVSAYPGRDETFAEADRIWADHVAIFDRRDGDG